MKRLNHLYDQCLELDNIYSIAHKVCSKVKNKDKVNRFETYMAEHVTNIYNRLSLLDTNLSRYNIFMITDPKCRIVMAQDIEDKILNHIIAEYILVKTYEPRFSISMAATRINKGTKYGIYLTKKYLNELKNKYDSFYVLKIDIKKYFYRIDHEILKSILASKINDSRALHVLNCIIDSTDERYINERINKLISDRIDYINSAKFINENDKYYLLKEARETPLYEKGKGCPIGDQTSQAFGLIYLYKFNEYLRKVLHLKYVINYMDDFIIFHHNKEYLKKCLDLIKNELLINYKLALNEKKTRIDHIKNGIEFLGYRFYLKNNKVIMRLRNNTKKRFKKKVKEIKYLYDNNVISKTDYQSLINTNKGHLKWGNCGNLLYFNSKV